MTVWRDWRGEVNFSAEGPGVTVLHESPELKVVLVGLDVGQADQENAGDRNVARRGEGKGEAPAVEVKDLVGVTEDHVARW